MLGPVHGQAFALNGCDVERRAVFLIQSPQMAKLGVGKLWHDALPKLVALKRASASLNAALGSACSVPISKTRSISKSRALVR